MTTATHDEMFTLLLAALRGDTHQHFALLIKYDKKRGRLYREGDITPEFEQIVHTHSEWLARQLKTNMVALYWNAGEERAQATLVPVVTTGPSKPFSMFELPFPPCQPRLVVDNQESE